MTPAPAWTAQHVEDPAPAAPGRSYVERLTEVGALDEATALFDALDRGEDPFGDEHCPAGEVVAEARRRGAA